MAGVARVDSLAEKGYEEGLPPEVERILFPARGRMASR